MSNAICIVGRQPNLGTAELESLYGSDNIKKLGTQAVLIKQDAQTIDFQRLGGSTRLCKHLHTIPSVQWQAIVQHLHAHLPAYVAELPEGKIKFGLSLIGTGAQSRTINQTGLDCKKIIKNLGRSVRVVPNNSTELNTAQVLHNQLTGPTGLEIVLIQHNGVTEVAQTVAVQDIEAYAARDQRRPKRDARVGMLPPKLAQIIINLATGKITERGLETEENKGDSPEIKTSIVLDPFCGTGVMLQEALLMGYRVIGADLEPRMVEYSQTNLEWLQQSHASYQLTAADYQLAVGDATTHTWEQFNIVACETYLGRPLSTLPNPETIREIMQDCDTIHRKFLQNLAKQTSPGFRACIAVPAWKSKNGFLHLKTLDNLESLGYNRVSFAHVRTNDLLYFRPDQIVARELVIIQRK